MTTPLVLNWLEGELRSFPTRASGEELYRFFLGITKPIIESDDPSDRNDLVEGLKIWINLRSEPRTMLAVEIVSVYDLKELQLNLEQLLNDVKRGMAFSHFYERPILKALNKLKGAMSKCPFKVGDRVVYKPSLRGYALDDDRRLQIGQEYRIEKIEEENYIVVEGYRHPGGGIFWTEFEKANSVK